MAQAASRNFVYLAVLRVISGAAYVPFFDSPSSFTDSAPLTFSEATADPAFILITGMWYTRTQQPTIIGYWYSANGIGIAVGGLLGYGIGNVCLHLSEYHKHWILTQGLYF